MLNVFSNGCEGKFCLVFVAADKNLVVTRKFLQFMHEGTVS